MTLNDKKLFPGFDRLYEISGPFDSHKDFCANISDLSFDEETLILRGVTLPKEPVLAGWVAGPNKAKDVIGGGPGVILISERVKHLLTQNQCTGWSTFPITLLNQRNILIEGYCGLSVTGRSGPQDEGFGELLTGKKLGTRYLRYRGIRFEESSWDGSDIFIAGTGCGAIFVTERVRQLFERHGLGYVDFTPLTEARWLKILPKGNVSEEISQKQQIKERYKDKELAPSGYVSSEPTKLTKEENIDYTIIYPFDNELGQKVRVCNTFEEAKAFALHLLSEETKELVILRGHKIFWTNASK